MTRFNIMILTSEYPNPNSTFDTPVVHFFVKEWKKAGHNVRVVHYRSIFPFFFYWVANLLGKLVKRLFKTDFIPTKPLKETVEYQIDQVLIFSEPIFKIFPHFRYSDKVIMHQVEKILNWNKLNEFKPDIIVGHFFNPQLILLSKLKNHYPDSITSLVLHESPIVIKQTFKRDYSSLMNGIDFFGFRFNRMKEDFISLYGSKYDTFICPSGIPAEYIQTNLTNDKFKHKNMRFCFAGMLIPLKNVDIIIEALNLSFPEKNFELTIIGKGMLQNKLMNKVNEMKLSNQIKFVSHLSRTEVQSEMSKNDCFVMVSEPEAFGLVYLEAMAKGCITIGTKGQGIDGVIEDGVNGFLCEARDVNALSKVFDKIKTMNYEELTSIGRKAIRTATNMTDEKVANNYLKIISNNISIK